MRVLIMVFGVSGVVKGWGFVYNLNQLFGGSDMKSNSLFVIASALTVVAHGAALLRQSSTTRRLATGRGSMVLLLRRN